MMGPTGPGPWDPAYGYPLGTGPSTGTPAPFPPPDAPPPAPQSPAAPGPTPQPPTVLPPPGGPPPALGDVTKDMTSQPALDVNKQFETYLDLQKRAMAGAERPYLSESTKPGLLRNILTFGMAGLMDQDYRTAYNSAIDQHNAGVHATAVKNALSMVADDVRGHSGDIGTQIRLLGLYQQMLNAQNTELHRRTVEDLRRRGLDISGARLDISERERLTHEMMSAPDEKGRAVLDDNDLKYVEDPRYPGHGWAVPKNSPWGGAGSKPPPTAPGGPGAPRSPGDQPLSLGASTTTSGGPPPTLPERHNNPGNIKDGSFAQSQPGYVGSGETAQDGGRFARFDSPASGQAAMGALLRSPRYSSLTVGAALSKWSNGGYGGEVAKGVGIDPSRTMSSLTADELNTLTPAMARREGFRKPMGAATAPTPSAPPAAGTPPAPPPAEQGAPGAGSLGTSGTTSNGIPYRVVQPGQPAAPNQPAAGGRNLADPNEPGISAEEKLRRQKLAEKTSAEPLPADVQKQVSMIDESIAGLNELEKLAQDPEVRKWVGPGISRVISQPAYYAGFGVSPKVNRFIQLTNYLNSQAVGPLLHGSRNEKIWAQIQAHLPKATDDPDFALDKIRQARTIYQTNRGIELGSSAITRGSAGATAP